MKRICISFIAGTFCCLAHQASGQEAAVKPPYERLLQGEDAKKAEKHHEQVLQLEAADDNDGAIRMAEELLALRTKVQGADHWETVDAKWSLVKRQKLAKLSPAQRVGWWKAYLIGIGQALQLEAKGKSVEAQPLWQEYRRWCEQVLGEQHPDTATSYGNLAFNLDAQGKFPEAQLLYQKALGLFRALLGEQHPETAGCYGNLAANLSDQGKFAEAQPLLQMALKLNREVLGEKHPDTAICHNNLAANLKAQGKYADAQPLYQKALDLNIELLGERNAVTAISYGNLAANLSAQAKYAEAQPLIQKALDISREVLGENHPDTASQYGRLGGILFEQGKYDDAQPLIRKALDLNLELLGERHPRTASSYYVLAANLEAQRQHAEAQRLFLKALDLNRELLGEQHPTTASSYFNLAVNLENQGEYAQAQTHFEKALVVHRALLGENHPDTATCYNSLAINQHAQGKLAEAQVHLERAIHSFESSRLVGASGLERSMLTTINPNLQLATLRAKNDPEKAWSATEMTLARGLLDQQAAGKVSLLTPAERADQMEQQNKLSSLQAEILFLVAKSQRTEAETKRLDERIGQRRQTEERLVALAVRISQREVALPAAIREALPNDAALLCWVDCGGSIQEHWGCVVRASGEPKWERLPGQGPKNEWTLADIELPKKLRAALASDEAASEITTLTQQLHSQRIAPLLQHLSGVQTLYVVPVDQMAGIPVEVLTTQYTISYVPSGTFLARLKNRTKPTGETLLALTDPIFTDASEKPTAPASVPPGGLLIKFVAPGGPADKAGLKAGDVLLKYGDTDLSDIDHIKPAIAANSSAKTIPVTVWREEADKPIIRDLGPGKLGVTLDQDPAPIAIANRRKTDAMLLSLRGGDWGDLPGTRVEASRIGNLFGQQATVLADSSASEQKLESLRRAGELKKYRYLHFATHGEGNNVRAFESSLILAQDSLPKDSLPKAGEPFINGQLSASEVLEFWKLDAELVTLSACETAVGSQGGGDGPLGFAQAFLTAGSRAVCLSLWKVDDTATTLLMDRFYQNLLGKRPGLDKPLGKAAALAEAKNWLRNLSSEEVLRLTADMTKGVVRGKGKKALPKVTLPQPDDPDAAKTFKPFSHPKYWAAFILIGDPD